jgi:hypothetical protein
MAYFGSQATTSIYAGNPLADVVCLGKFTLTEAGTVSKLTIYCDNQGSGYQACNAKGLIYAADGSGGRPSTLKAASGAVAVSANQAAGWVDFTLSVALAAGDYWLGGMADASGTGWRMYGQTSGGYIYAASDTYSDGPADPCSTTLYGGSPHEGTSLVCVYATYTTTPSGISIPLLNHLLLGD